MAAEGGPRDVRQRKYKPPTSQCGLYLRCRTSRRSACFARRPIERPQLRASSVAPCLRVKSFFFVIFVIFAVEIR